MVCAPSLGHFIGRCEPSACLELSRKIRISGKSFSTVICKKGVYIQLPEYLGHWSRDSEFTSSNILEVLLKLLLYWVNAPNYRQNERFLEICSRVRSMLKVSR